MPAGNPTVTVITAAWNVAPFISQTILSVLDQTYQDFEYLIVDDGSSDETLAIAREFEKKDARLHVLHQERQGAGEARNLALRQAQGKYISFLDGDDFWKPQFLEQMVGEIECRENDYAAVFCWSENLLSRSGVEKIENHRPNSGDYDLPKMLMGCPPGNGSCLIIRRQCFIEAGMFSNQRVAQDAEMWLRILKDSQSNRFYCLPQKLVSRRMRTGSLWASHHLERLQAWEKRVETYISHCHPKFKCAIYSRYVIDALIHLNPSDSPIIRKWCLKAVTANLFEVVRDRRKWSVLIILLFGVHGFRSIKSFKNSFRKDKTAAAPHPRYMRNFGFFAYDTKTRWMSYWAQIYSVLIHDPQTVLTIGKGNGFMDSYLRNQAKVKVSCLDNRPELAPDIVGDVRKLSHYVGIKSFDVVCAFQILEHLPYEEFENSISELSRVATRAVIISLPCAGTKLIFSLGFRSKMWRWGRSLMWHKSKLKTVPYHFWEIGVPGYPLKRIRQDLEKFLYVKKEYFVPENPYHYFFECVPRDLAEKDAMPGERGR